MDEEYHHCKFESEYVGKRLSMTMGTVAMIDAAIRSELAEMFAAGCLAAPSSVAFEQDRPGGDTFVVTGWIVPEDRYSDFMSMVRAGENFLEPPRANDFSFTITRTEDI